jgi:hypothetical protein
MHSWRVLILPQLSRDDLYRRYRFDEPWDGPNNRKLHGEVVSVFKCPSVDQSTQTNYVAIVGEKTAWPGAKSRRLDEIKDDASTTILVTENAHSGIHWMEPRDLDFDNMSFQINGLTWNSIRGVHPWSDTKKERCVVIARTDGSVKWIPETADPETLKAMLTISGGEQVDEESLW